MTEQERITKPQKGLVHLILGAIGIYFSYILLGICSEQLYNSTYTSTVEVMQDGTAVTHSFTHPSIIVWMSALFCSLLGQIKSILTSQPRSTLPTKQSFILGLISATNMLSSSTALLYISYPTHALASNSRYLVIVLIGTYFSRVPHKDDLKLPKHKLYVAVVITAGVVLFNVMKFATVDTGDHHVFEGEWKGYLLLTVSMLAQAMFCDSQAYCKAVFKPTANQLFKTANFYAFLFSFVHAIVTGSLLPSIQFVMTHPECLKLILLMCTLQLTGQLSIYHIVTNFKQHIFPMISATRKIITVVCSIIIFNHTLSLMQILCVLIVFGGMIVEVYEEIVEKRQQSSQKLIQINEKQGNEISQKEQKGQVKNQ